MEGVVEFKLVLHSLTMALFPAFLRRISWCCKRFASSKLSADSSQPTAQQLLMQFCAGIFAKCLLTHHGRPSLRLSSHAPASMCSMFQLSISSILFCTESPWQIARTVVSELLAYFLMLLDSIHESRSWSTWCWRTQLMTSWIAQPLGKPCRVLAGHSLSYWILM